MLYVRLARLEHLGRRLLSTRAGGLLYEAQEREQDQQRDRFDDREPGRHHAALGGRTLAAGREAM
jgi:hypothetical protein